MKKKLSSNYKDWKRKTIKITNLFLDPENIRLQVARKTQDSLINDLFINENAMQILESIAINGFFPDEPPVAVEEDDKIIVIDGNRRVSALKVLNRPILVPSKEKKIKGMLKDISSDIKEIEVIIAPERESIRHFLASKHTQNTKRPWRPLRQAYFYKAELQRGKTINELKTEYPSVDIPKFIKLLNMHKIAKSYKYEAGNIEKKVHNDRLFPASTIERLYSDKQVRDFLGFDFTKNGEVKIRISKKEFDKGYKKIIADVIEKTVDSRALNNETNRKTYLDSFQKADIPKKKKGSKVTTSKDFKELTLQTTTIRNKLAPKDIKFSLQAPGVKRMLVELQGIVYKTYPNATHDLLRSFLECSLKAYFYQTRKTIPKKGKYVFLHNVLNEFKKEMDQKGNNELSQVTQRIISNEKMSGYTAESLNATNHNPSVFAIPSEVEDAWDSMEKIFRYILHEGLSNNESNS